MIVSISWRNVWRNKLRSFVIIMAITVGLVGGVFTVAVYNGMSEQKLRTAIDTQTAHLQIHARGFQKNKDIRLYIKQPENILSAIQEQQDVEGVATRLIATGMAATSTSNAGVQLNGIIPEQERRVSTIYQFVREGDYFESGKKNQILISSKTAKKLKLKLRSKVIITLQDINGQIVGAAFRVGGIFKTTHSLFDEGNVFVKKQDLERVLGAGSTINEIALRMKSIGQVEKLLQNFESKFDDQELDIQSWREIQPELAYINDATWQINFLILIIILLALAFGILNTMLMAIFERVKEIGVLMAVGMNRFKIFTMIVLETVFLSLTGAFVGLGVSALLVRKTNSSGINLSRFTEGLESWGLGNVIYPQLEAHFYLNIAAMVVVTALLSSIYPALKALKLNPVDAIHG
ncbi:ABC transporter permease [Fulvivirga sp. 29W222]|uniref:ABC transporter permease n=1 Tax=Fulvivirga marina TaxID=2494733 RepID=A0A937KGI8_9BACT|nr:FtsX-like permease family protein [Fulvivirga marina]MBL6449238.1 ABC transporter permease [Fulvivirga marina]